MTKLRDDNNGFLRLGNYKMECDAALLRNFAEACEYKGCSRPTILRHLMTEFVDQVRDEILSKAQLVKSKGGAGI